MIFSRLKEKSVVKKKKQKKKQKNVCNLLFCFCQNIGYWNEGFLNIYVPFTPLSVSLPCPVTA